MASCSDRLWSDTHNGQYSTCTFNEAPIRVTETRRVSAAHTHLRENKRQGTGTRTCMWSPDVAGGANVLVQMADEGLLAPREYIHTWNRDHPARCR